jgi:alginate O-acetyltransferase complex protein AlgI
MDRTARLSRLVDELDVRRLVNSLSSFRLAEMSLGRFLAITAQLALLLGMIDRYKIEELSGFLFILPLIFVGFTIHACLPFRYRLPFFLLLSLTAITVVLQKHGIGLIVLGLGLIGICHLPIAFFARVALLIIAAGGFAALRAQLIATSWDSLPTLVLPILGSMFMFRLIVYLYDLRHETKPATIWERLSYFFLLPNVCFPLFPVVDYQTFRRTYYDSSPHEIYQKGLLWMLRGTIHLLLYRLVYYHFTLSLSEVQNLGGVVQFMLANYLLYLRISGQFHMIAGILCLFGFNLPETHHLYFLASGFNDYWRRINIYWKDFMVKLFYYPAFMRLRKLGTTTAMALATIVVFAATWLLHSYQWFWLRGSFPITGPDTLFWSILGGLVLINSLIEAKKGRKRAVSQRGWSLRAALSLSLRTVGMFTFICILWSLWSSTTVAEWLALVSVARRSGPWAFLLLAAGLALVALAGVLIQYVTHRGWNWNLVGSHPPFVRSAVYTSAMATILALLSLPGVSSHLGQQTSEALASVRENRLNKRDAEQLQRGYYEGLIDSDKYTTALWTIRAGKPKGWLNTQEARCIRFTDDILVYEHIPSYAGLYKFSSFKTNGWGMRDGELEQAKPAGTYRLALLGASYEVGAGVPEEQIFPALIEDRLNRDHAGGGHERFEILNFAVEGYSVVHNLKVLKDKVLTFEPDTVFLHHYIHAKAHLINHLTWVVEKEAPIEFPELREIMVKTGATSDMDSSEIRRRLEPVADEILRWGLREIARTCREQGILPVWVFVPLTEQNAATDPKFLDSLVRYARDSGFVVLNLDGIFLGENNRAMWLAPWDSHPSARGHRLIADRLYQVMLQNEKKLKLGLGRSETAEGTTNGSQFQSSLSTEAPPEDTHSPDASTLSPGSEH